jgi:hypothetical protein
MAGMAFIPYTASNSRGDRRLFYLVIAIMSLFYLWSQ